MSQREIAAGLTIYIYIYIYIYLFTYLFILYLTVSGMEPVVT